MKVDLQDFYGQHVSINNETGSGNIRLRVRTMESLNDLRGKSADECDVETDISLNENHLDIIIGALTEMRRTMDQ